MFLSAVALAALLQAAPVLEAAVPEAPVAGEKGQLFPVSYTHLTLPTKA